MVDKGHCFMPREEYGNLSKYYDFTDKLTKLMNGQEMIIELSDDDDSWDELNVKDAESIKY